MGARSFVSYTMFSDEAWSQCELFAEPGRGSDEVVMLVQANYGVPITHQMRRADVQQVRDALTAWLEAEQYPDQQ